MKSSNANRERLQNKRKKNVDKRTVSRDDKCMSKGGRKYKLEVRIEEFSTTVDPRPLIHPIHLDHLDASLPFHTLSLHL